MDVYTICTVLAGILWGLISVFLKGLTAAGLSSVQVMMVRAIFSSVFLLIFILVKDKSFFKIELKDLWMFVGTGVVSLTFFSLCYFRTILEIGTSIAVILLYTSPIFILILSFFIFKEKITYIKIIALILTFAGCILVTGIGSRNQINMRGFLIGLCAGLGYALYSIFSRFALKKYNPLTVTFYTFVFSGLSLIPLCNVGELLPLFTPKITLLSLGIAFFCSFLPYILYTFGLSGLENGKAAILVTVEPLVGTLIGFFLWKEDFSLEKIAGIILIFIAVIVINLKSTK